MPLLRRNIRMTESSIFLKMREYRLLSQRKKLQMNVRNCLQSSNAEYFCWKSCLKMKIQQIRIQRSESMIFAIVSIHQDRQESRKVL